jgi:hypothetical protein
MPQQLQTAFLLDRHRTRPWKGDVSSADLNKRFIYTKVAFKLGIVMLLRRRIAQLVEHLTVVVH